MILFRKRALAEDHPDRLTSQLELAVAYRENNQIEEAISLLKLVVSIRKRALAEDYPDLLGSQHELGVTHLRNNQIEMAISILEIVVNIQKRTLAEGHPDLQHALAIAYEQLLSEYRQCKIHFLLETGTHVTLT
jgi:tetratricopeptide (TPR) repeat protein